MEAPIAPKIHGANGEMETWCASRNPAVQVTPKPGRTSPKPSLRRSSNPRQRARASDPPTSADTPPYFTSRSNVNPTMARLLARKRPRWQETGDALAKLLVALVGGRVAGRMGRLRWGGPHFGGWLRGRFPQLVWHCRHDSLPGFSRDHGNLSLYCLPGGGSLRPCSTSTLWSRRERGWSLLRRTLCLPERSPGVRKRSRLSLWALRVRWTLLRGPERAVRNLPGGEHEREPPLPIMPCLLQGDGTAVLRRSRVHLRGPVWRLPIIQSVRSSSRRARKARACGSAP